MQPVPVKQCLACGQTIRGRSDKKFCRDSCRNQYHNQQAHTANACQRIIEGLLRKNRRILQQLLSPDQDKCLCKKTILENRGFNFRFFTHIRPIRGHNSFFCYEFGYQELKENRIRVFREDIIGMENITGDFNR